MWPCGQKPCAEEGVREKEAWIPDGITPQIWRSRLMSMLILGDREINDHIYASFCFEGFFSCNMQLNLIPTITGPWSNNGKQWNGQVHKSVTWQLITGVQRDQRPMFPHLMSVRHTLLNIPGPNIIWSITYLQTYSYFPFNFTSLTFSFKSL